MMILRRLLLLTFVPTLAALAQTAVRAWEEPLVIPTYKVEAPEPNPIFYTGRAYQGAKGPIYPYPLIDKLTDTKEDRSYKALYLENKYIKLCVLPELGGRIFAATDKTNNYDFFYRQHVIKPALIGMLGAWISGGVEWNVPHHHRASTFMTVDHAISENPDGSKTIWVGEIELRHRMKWLVGITLHPDRSSIEVSGKIFNRTPLAHSMLFFANAAVHANSSYQVIFPPSTEYATYHGKNQFVRWPIADGSFSGIDYKGIDLSRWKNHPSPISFFAWNYEDDFFAGYDHGKQAGVALVADHNIVPGKKFFEWGNGSQGEMWDRILTDTDGPYLELMVGAYSDNQPDYSWIQPYEVRTFKLCWYPIRNIRGLKNANAQAAVNLEVTPGRKALIGLNATSEQKDAQVLLTAGERIVFQQRIDIGPSRPFLKEVPLTTGTKESDLTVTLFTSEGEELIHYAPVRKEGAPRPEPVKPPPSPQAIKTVDELYLAGLRLDQFYNPALEPDPYYEEALERDPGDYRANTALGLLLLKRAMFREAEERFRAAIERVTKNFTSPKDGEAFYYLGVALRAQGKYEAALAAFHKATWSQGWRSAAYQSLAEIECRNSNYSKALEFIDRSLAHNSISTKALNLKAALLRKLARFGEAAAIAGAVLAADPLDAWATNELRLARTGLGLKEEAATALDALAAKMRGEAQSYLELAVDYGNCGLWNEAIDLLALIAESKTGQAATYPLVYYYLGYCWEMRGDRDKSEKYYRLASSKPPDYCFPFQFEMIEVLQRASGVNPRDARAPYYLGNLLYDHQPQRAIREWERSRALDSTFSIVHRNLGLAYARILNDIQRAIASLERAVACDPTDPRLYFEFDQMYEAGGVSAEKRLAVLEPNHATVVRSDDALAREILLHLQVGHYDRAIELLKGHHFHVWEGGGMIHDVYVDAHVLRGQNRLVKKQYKEALKDFEAALEYPANLEVGRPSRDVRALQIYYFIGTALEALGDAKKSRSYYEKAVAETYGWSEVRYHQGLAFRKLGRSSAADEVFEGLIKEGNRRLASAAGLDFFAKFGEKQSEVNRLATAHYLLGLGYKGKGKKGEAESEFKQTLELDRNHLGAKVQLADALE